MEGDGAGATVYRTHPHVYSSTFVASGDDDGYYASLEATDAPPPAVSVGVVSAANGAGLSLLNTIVLSRSNRRSRGVEVSGCSNEMDVGNEAAIGAPDAAEATPTSARLFVSDRNVIAGFGAHLVDAFGAFPTSMHEVLSRTGEYHYVGSSTTRRAFDETWLAANASPRDESRFEEVPARDWRAFGLSAGCEAKLNLADYKRPQLHSLFFPSETSAAVLDPRPTEGMRVAHKVDQPSIRASRGFALSANAPPTAKAMIDAFLSETVEFPGAFTPDLSSVWFGPSVRKRTARGGRRDAHLGDGSRSRVDSSVRPFPDVRDGNRDIRGLHFRQAQAVVYRVARRTHIFVSSARASDDASPWECRL